MDLKKPVSRIAPTPSGYLHIGNAYNFLLTWWTTRYYGGKIWLRIDDADTARRRPEFIDDIFQSIKWLGIDYDFGARNTEDFLKNHSQEWKKEDYFQEIQKHLHMKESKESHSSLLFPCECSRKSINQNSVDGTYPGTCRDKGMHFSRGECALRMGVKKSFEYAYEDKSINLSRSLGDFIIWRKDDIPAYQLTSVLDDIEAQVNLVIRGEDLLESSAAQVYLSNAFNLDFHKKTRIIHHPLLLDANGEKLSKSSNTKTLGSALSNIHLKKLREGSSIESANNRIELLNKFANAYGIKGEKIESARDLLRFSPPY